jgi:hypothetical protein
MSSTNLKVPFEGKDGSVKSLICKFRKLIQAMQESNNVSGEEPKLAGKILGVKFFKDEWPAHVGRRFGASSFPPGKNVGFDGRLQRLMRNFSRKEVGCVFTKKPCNLGKPLP